MQKRLFAALGSLTLLTAGAAFAQSNALMQADIPFAFRAGNNVLPAGQYDIRPEVAPGVISLRCSACKAHVMIVTGQTYSRAAAGKGTLVFNRYGSANYLSKVLTPGYTVGRELPKSKAELESARSAPPEPVTVAVR